MGGVWVPAQETDPIRGYSDSLAQDDAVVETNGQCGGDYVDEKNECEPVVHADALVDDVVCVTVWQGDVFGDGQLRRTMNCRRNKAARVVELLHASLQKDVRFVWRLSKTARSRTHGARSI